jgi:hypothetical protein
MVAHGEICIVTILTANGRFQFAVLREPLRARALARELVRLGIPAAVNTLSGDEAIEFERPYREGDCTGCGALFSLIEAAGLCTTTHPFWDAIVADERKANPAPAS